MGGFHFTFSNYSHLQPFTTMSFETQIQWGSEIRTCLDFEWLTLVWFSNGLVFKCFRQTIRKPDKNVQFSNGFWHNGCHFVKKSQKPFGIRLKMSGFQMAPVFNGSIFRMVRFRIPTVHYFYSVLSENWMNYRMNLLEL